MGMKVGIYSFNRGTGKRIPTDFDFFSNRRKITLISIYNSNLEVEKTSNHNAYKSFDFYHVNVSGETVLLINQQWVFVVFLHNKTLNITKKNHGNI